MEYMEEILQTVTAIGRVLIVIVVSIIKAFLPVGFLPRKSVRGEVCLITGAGSGIGRLMAMEFAKLGCTMVLWDVNTGGNEETKAMIAKTGATVHTYTVDVSKKEQINAAASKVLKEVGSVDILINNAGIVTGKTLINSPDDWIERTMAVNASACLYTAKNFVRSMIDKNHGHVVTIASIAGKVGGAGVMTLVMPYLIHTGMFDGFDNKSPGLIPNLEPEYVVDCIMEAVLTNKEELIMPKILYWLSIVNFLPTEAKMIIFEYLGQLDGMDHFKGRKPITA